jgi:hypothetical protein
LRCPRTRKLSAELLVDVGASIQNIEHVRDALVKFGDAGAEAADRLATGLRGIS